MTPYLAVIKDSFREALASRVLWILLVLITLFLIAITPFGWDWQLSTNVQMGDIRDVPKFVEDARRAKAGTPAEKVWSSLSAELRDRVGGVDKKDERRRYFELQFELIAELNKAIEQEDFFSAEVWKDAPLDDEAKALAAKKNRDKTENGRLNRLAIEAAFPGRIQSRPEKSMQFKYMHWPMFPPIPVTDELFDTGVQAVLSTFMKLILGVVGVFVAILVTASVIPNMFDPGSINLLLSKPISRSMLFLAKFFGGCSFVLINSAYLLFGLWLLAGLRHGIWQNALLLCIPIFMFIFIIYYCVSALSGLIWRNAIVSIVFAIMFWGMCFGIGIVKGSMDLYLIEPARITNVVEAGEDVMAVTNAGQTVRWEADEKSWSEVIAGSPTGMWLNMQPVAGPVFDAKNQRVAVAVKGWPSKLVVASKEKKWAKREVADCPAGTKALFIGPHGDILLATVSGVFRLRSETPAEMPKLKMFGFDVPLNDVLGEQAGPLEMISPDGFRIDTKGVVAIDAVSGALLVWNQDQVARYSRDEEGKYIHNGDADVDYDGQDKLIRIAGNIIIVAKSDGSIEVRDRETLDVKNSFRPFQENQPRSVVASQDGHWFCVVYHHRKAFLYDTVENKRISTGPIAKSDISGAAFTQTGMLTLADQVDRVRVYSLPEWKLQDQRKPKLGVARKIYHWAVAPMYFVFPKPSQLDETRDYLLTKKETAVVDHSEPNLAKAQLKLDPWTPVWSSAAFVFVVLGISCVYVSRKEF